MASAFHNGAEHFIDSFWENADLVGKGKDDPGCFLKDDVITLKQSRSPSSPSCHAQRKRDRQDDADGEISRKRVRPASAYPSPEPSDLADLSDLTDLSDLDGE